MVIRNINVIKKRRKLKSLKAIIKETSSHYHVLDIDVDECYIEDIIEQANLIKNQYDSACETLDIVSLIILAIFIIH